jgi:ribosomal protein S18 acetylase RimI-like enzyme
MTAEEAAARLRHQSQAWAVVEATRTLSGAAGGVAPAFGGADTASMQVRPVAVKDVPWVSRVVSETFASPRIVSRGVIHIATELPGLVAEHDGTPIGLLLYDIAALECEVVVLLAFQERTGVATHLLARAERLARAAGSRRLWLVTTNDNLSAIAFYRARGWRQVAVRRGAVAEARRLKPEIPEFGTNGLPKEDEIEFELALGEPRRTTACSRRPSAAADTSVSWTKYERGCRRKPRLLSHRRSEA